MCIARVALLRGNCLGAALNGGACDETALDADVTDARQRALDRLQRSCTVNQLQNLGYIDLQDAQKDVINACRQLDTAAMSAAFGPVIVRRHRRQRRPGQGGVRRRPARASRRAAALRDAHLSAGARPHRRHRPDRASRRSRLVDWAASAASRARRRRRRRDRRHVSRERLHRRVPAQHRRLPRPHRRAAPTAWRQSSTCRTPSPARRRCAATACRSADEECDDGNDYDGDGCRSDCVKTECDVFPTTYDLIQKAIFENHGCTNDACHGSAKSGGLDLRAGASYASLVDVAVEHRSARKRIEPGDPQRASLLWLNLAARTLPDQYDRRRCAACRSAAAAAQRGRARGAAACGSTPAARRATPTCRGVARSAERLRARARAGEDRAADSAGARHRRAAAHAGVDAATRRASPRSASPATTTSPTRSRPRCSAPTATRFRYKRVEIRQDPLSHHLIVDLYRGAERARTIRRGAATSAAAARRTGQRAIRP